jgi:hypothetical protein
MRFQDRYAPSTEAPKDAFYACLGLSEILAQEIANAYAIGTGPGTPNAMGLIQEGTILPGSIVMLASDNTWVAGTSPVLSGGGAVLPKPLFFVHEGDVDLTGRQVGRLTALRGLARFYTTAVNGSTYAANDPLIANAGNFELKVQGDGKQIVGWVGPDGFRDGRLDVIFEACCWG